MWEGFQITVYAKKFPSNSPPSWGFDVPLATALCKTVLLRILNDS
jgi:hypothetical protein